MRDLPGGTVTFLFTDVEGSTRLLHQLGAEGYAEALAEHRRVIREACAAEGGVEVDTQGDAFFFAFPTAPRALEAARAIVDGLAPGRIAVRVGLHTGSPLLTEEGYVGDDVHRAARIAAAGHGGQVLISAATATLVREPLVDLGEHRFKDLSAPERVYQLGERDFPHLKTLYQTNLPVPSTAFLGRERELGEVCALRDRDDVRLLTLTGPGGTGKTRLALQAAGALAERYPDGVWWVPLAALRDPTLVLETAAQALGATDGLASHVGDKKLLVLFDNFEHLLDAAPDLSDVLEECPHVELLATSREPLRLRGEQEYAVPPFADAEAVGFFVAKARAVDPGYEQDDAVPEICRRLDSLPLALELAAARVKAMATTQILARLGQRLPLLTGGARDAPERQRTLRATIEWSHDLLSAAEQKLFARLAVFAGGCTLEAAEEVAHADIDTLRSLVDKSLVRFSDGRYWMLETIREYSAERLDASGEADVLIERLARHLIVRAVADDAPLFETDQAAAFAWLEAEHPNTRVVMEWALTHGRRDLVAELVAWLNQAWGARGHYDEARRWVDAALESRGAVPEALWARVLIAASDTLKEAGDDARAAEVVEELVETMADREGVDQLTVASALADLSDLARRRGDLAAARTFAVRSLEVRRKHGLPRARALSSLGHLALAEGDLREAECRYEEAAADYRRVGHDLNYAGALHDLGEVARRARKLDRATELFTEALQVNARLGSLLAVGECLLDLALVAEDHGDLARAARLWGAGHALIESVGGRPWAEREIGSIPEDDRLEGAAMSLEDAVEYALGSPDA